MSEMRLHDHHGHRLYLNAEERRAFLLAARRSRREVRTFCETLHYTGCRLSEALELTPRRIDLASHQITLRSLKKRRTDVYRTVPVPQGYLDTLDTAHGLREALQRVRGRDRPLWDWSRRHGWKIVKDVMIEAGIAEGPHRCPKGLRHGYGINAIVAGVPLNMLSKWMGHADIKTTAIYADAIGPEEQDIASRMWEILALDK